MASKRKRRKRVPFIAVEAVYPGGLNRELDRQLVEAAGRESDGSGCLLIGDQERDNSWYFEMEQRGEAEIMAGRLKNLPVSVTVRPIVPLSGRISMVVSSLEMLSGSL